MIIVLAGACVFAAGWLVSLPPPAALRLRAALGPSPRAWSTYAEAATATLHRVRGVVDRGRREAARRRAAVIQLCDGIAVELAAGRPPGAALIHTAETLTPLPGLTAATDAARGGDDVATALVHASSAPGCEGLRLLAGCWRIGVERGGMLADVIEGLADALRDEQSHREDVTLQLAGPRATARLLAGLPLLGLGMAAALGARPLSFLVGTLPGALCLILGTALDALGLWWTSRLAAAAETLR
ncbi:MAG: type II secretion system F family protein [Gaiellaceae bacterium]